MATATATTSNQLIYYFNPHNDKKSEQHASKKRSWKQAYKYLSVDAGDLTEIMIFLITCTIALQKAKSFYHFIATLPVNYSAAYATSRFVMALEMTARSNKTFKLHRMAGILCLPYSLVCWYRMVVLEANTTENYWFEMFDTMAWRITAVCATLNIISGIFMLPHVSKRAPVSVKQGFGVGALFCAFLLLSTLIVDFYSTLRVQGNRFELGIYALLVLLACIVGASPTIMSICMLLILDSENKSNKLVEQQTTTTTIVAQMRATFCTDNSPPAEKSLFQKIKSFFCDAFVSPNHTKQNTDQDNTPKWLKIANIVIGIALPILPIMLACVNFGLTDNLPGLSPLNDNYSKRVANMASSASAMADLSVMPAVMFDMTLLLLKKKNEKRLAVEILAAACTGMLVTAMLPCAIFSPEEMQIHKDLTKALFYPLLG